MAPRKNYAPHERGERERRRGAAASADVSRPSDTFARRKPLAKKKNTTLRFCDCSLFVWWLRGGSHTDVSGDWSMGPEVAPELGASGCNCHPPARRAFDGFQWRRRAA